jgi:hypothetical protein
MTTMAAFWPIVIISPRSWDGCRSDPCGSGYHHRRRDRLLSDYRKVTSKWRSLTNEWWSAGPLRRRFGVRAPSFRFIGALLLMMGVLVLVSTAFWPPASG